MLMIESASYSVVTALGEETKTKVIRRIYASSLLLSSPLRIVLQYLGQILEVAELSHGACIYITFVLNVPKAVE